MAITVVVLDDHYLIREGIRRLLDDHFDVELVAEGSVGDELFPLVERYRPDIILLDLGMPQTAQGAMHAQGPEFAAFPAIVQLRQDYPDTRIIIVSQYGTKTLVAGALEAGVKGYLLKSDALTQNLVEAIRMVHFGGVYFSDAIGQKLLEVEEHQPPPVLTDRQREIVRAVAANPNLSQAEHAQRLGISEHTLKQHLRQIYRGLGVSNLTAAVIKAIQLRIVPLSYVTSVAGGADPVQRDETLPEGNAGLDRTTP